MQKLKKIFFTVFLLVVSVMQVKAVNGPSNPFTQNNQTSNQNTILTCEYNKPSDKNNGMQEVNVLCNVYNGYFHQCYLEVDGKATINSKNVRIENWSSLPNLSWQARKYVEDNNKCPDYLLIKLDNNNSQIYAADTQEYIYELQDYLSGNRYIAALNGVTVPENNQMKRLEDTINGYTNEINTTINNFSLVTCENSDDENSRFTECNKIVSNLKNNVANWDNDVNDWVFSGYFNEEDEVVKNYRAASAKVAAFYQTAMAQMFQQGHQGIVYSPNTGQGSSVENFCQDVKILTTLRFLGYIILAIRSVIPALLIVFGTIDFAKALVSSSSDTINKSTKSFVTRVVAGIAIFFIPVLVNFTFSLVRPLEASFYDCRVCIFKPSNCKI